MSPFLRETLQADLAAAADAIADALDRPYTDWPIIAQAGPDPIRRVSLASGTAGVALFFAHHAVARGSARSQALTQQFLEESIAGLSRYELSPSLFCGFTGVAWVTERVLRLFGDETSDPNEQIDQALLDFLHGERARHSDYDLIDGLVGIGVYALERLPRRAAAQMIDQILSLLEAGGVEQQDGSLAYPTGRELARRSGEPIASEAYNAGLAHGHPGLIGWLALVLRHDPQQSCARLLLRRIAAWQRSSQLSSPRTSIFPDFVAATLTPEAARCAWCYGDPGVSVTLHAAGHVLGDPQLTGLARAAAHLAARRDWAEGSIVDAGLCHGATGVALILHELGQALSDQLLLDSAASWYRRTLELRRTMTGIAGFTTFTYERTEAGEWVDDPCFLTGAAGIGLSLLRATGSIDARWCRALLVVAED